MALLPSRPLSCSLSRVGQDRRTRASEGNQALLSAWTSSHIYIFKGFLAGCQTAMWSHHKEPHTVWEGTLGCVQALHSVSWLLLCQR